MLAHGNLLDPILMNTIGHTSGLLLFGAFIGLLIRDRQARGRRQIKLPLIAALLALGWNIGSLIALALPDPDSKLIEIVMTASFSILSLLPAVLLQVALQGQQRFVVAGYLVSGCAIALHSAELLYPSISLHQAALMSVVIGFGILTTIALLVRYRRRADQLPEKAEAISLGCLLLFTSSFLHFGYQHLTSPWAVEIAWHHIGIPVALIVLLQDYRFLLLDAFIRFLVNFALAAVYVSTLLVLNQSFRLWESIRSSLFLTGLILVAFGLSLIMFASLRNAAQTWVSQVIFRRKVVDGCIKAITNLASSSTSQEDLLAGAAQLVADHLRTRQFAILAEGSKASTERPAILFRQPESESFSPEQFHAEVRIPLRFSSGDACYLALGVRRGGRRYLSEDVEDMRQLGAAIVEQVERFRAEELRRLASQAELRALQAQINPHFLFNALNTLYGTIDRGSYEARRMVLNLADIFRYFLQGDRKFIPLSEELRIVEAYLEIEQLRLGDRLGTELVISEAARSVLIPILSVQPLVENAVKHGIAPKGGNGRVRLRAELVSMGLQITVEDTGLGFQVSGSRSPTGTGMGLDNVRRRLTLCYGIGADLQINSSALGTIITFTIPTYQNAAQEAADIQVEA